MACLGGLIPCSGLTKDPDDDDDDEGPIRYYYLPLPQLENEENM